MSLVIDLFKTPGNRQENIRIRKIHQLTGKEAAAVREEILVQAQTASKVIYLDASDVVHADLSGINEIIHTSYCLQNLAKQFVLVYRKKSVVEKWVETTGLHRFVDTALLPSL